MDPHSIRVRELAPGVWEDAAGSAHFAIPELLQHLGIPLTPENEAEALDLAEMLIRARYPNKQVVLRKTPPPPEPVN